MNDLEWKVLCDFKKQFKAKIDSWKNKYPELLELQKEAAILAGTPEYSFENSIVYNSDLDRLTKDDQIKLIVIGDNPGKDEQLNINQKYLCGQAGKIAEGWFKKNLELKIDFRKNVIILNKTPVHSAKTVQLKTIMKKGGKKITDLINESQLWMAEETSKLHQKLCEASENNTNPELWLVGYSELKEKGFFSGYRDCLKKTYLENGSKEIFEKSVFVYQHFSMNRFSIDLGDFSSKNTSNSLKENLIQLGTLHRDEIFVN